MRERYRRTFTGGLLELVEETKFQRFLLSFFSGKHRLEEQGGAAPVAKHMIRIKPEPNTPAKAPSPQEEAKNTSTKQKAADANKGGPKDVKKDKRMGVGRR